VFGWSADGIVRAGGAAEHGQRQAEAQKTKLYVHASTSLREDVQTSRLYHEHPRLNRPATEFPAIFPGKFLDIRKDDFDLRKLIL
jgi:hypothetical protein